MEIKRTDLQKVELIAAHAQVNDLILLLRNINKDVLVGALAGVSPENRDILMYRIMAHTLEFYNKIDKELEESKEELEK